MLKKLSKLICCALLLALPSSADILVYSFDVDDHFTGLKLATALSEYFELRFDPSVYQNMIMVKEGIDEEFAFRRHNELVIELNKEYLDFLVERARPYTEVHIFCGSSRQSYVEEGRNMLKGQQIFGFGMHIINAVYEYMKEKLGDKVFLQKMLLSDRQGNIGKGFNAMLKDPTLYALAGGSGSPDVSEDDDTIETIEDFPYGPDYNHSSQDFKRSTNKTNIYYAEMNRMKELRPNETKFVFEPWDDSINVLDSTAKTFTDGNEAAIKGMTMQFMRREFGHPAETTPRAIVHGTGDFEKDYLRRAQEMGYTN